MNAVPPPPIGMSVPRLDARAKVTGEATYTIDLGMPGMCHARVLRSPYPHARIRSIDVEAARRAPGVVAVVSAADLSDVDLLYGHAVRDHPILAVERVRHVGEPVVGVVAEDLLAAEEALELVEVDYEPLPFVIDAVEALADDAPAIHAGSAERGAYGGEREAIQRAHPNLCTRIEHGWGDMEAAFGGAALVLDDVYEYPMAYAYAMEPYVAIAAFDAHGLTVVTSAQHAFMVQAELSRCFHLPLSAVRVSIPYVGGGYGSKSYSKIEPLTAALALRAGRPVRLALSIEESMITARSASARIRLATAFDADGRIRGRRATCWVNGGPYAENTPRVAGRMARRVGGPYRIPALAAEALAVYTNAAPAGSYRGLGAPQGVFAGESQLDEAAARLGIDPLELRRRNLLRPGERAWPGARGMDADLVDDLRMAEETLSATPGPASGRDGDPAPAPARPAGAAALAHGARGTGFAVGGSDAGAEPTSSAVVRVLADGSVIVLTGSSELGQGSSTVLAQIAAGELGVDLSQVRLVRSDTALVSYDRSTGASRTTPIMGLAIQRAAADARQVLVGWATALHGREGDRVLEVVEERGGVRVGDRHYGWSRIIQDWFGDGAGEVVGRGYVRRDGVTAELPLFWEVAVIGIDVSVDEELGEIHVHRLATVGDVGCAINPQLAEGQDAGAAMMGLGVALREELRYADGSLVNGNLFEYRVPRPSDLPELCSALAERGDGVGPYGAKGGGEGSLNPVAPALANAVFWATGVRMREAPLTPERVWRALRRARS